jgi:hypothetical protein
LGPHRIFCGNALEGTSYDNLLYGSKASLIFTDPPYNVTIDGNVGGKGQIHHRTFAMGCGEMTTSGFTSFLTNTFQHLAAHSLDGSIHYTCMDWRHMQEMLAAGYGVYRTRIQDDLASLVPTFKLGCSPARALFVAACQYVHFLFSLWLRRWSMQIAYIREEIERRRRQILRQRRNSRPSARGYPHKVRGRVAGPDANQGR